MSRRDQTIALVLGTLLVVLAVGTLVLRPRHQDVQDLDRTIAAERQRVDQAAGRLAQLQAAAQDEPALRREVRRLERAIPGAPRHPALLRQVERERTRLFQDADFQGASGGGQGPAAGGASPVPFSLTYAGSFRDLRRTIAGLQDDVRLRRDEVRSSGRLLVFTGLEVESRDGRLQGRLAATAFVATPAAATPPGATAKAIQP